MKRTDIKKRTKKATTLVELVVSMALTAIFAGACVMLVMPVERIYTHTTDLSRAQILADTVVYSLRTECAKSYITGNGDVWIGNVGNERLDSVDSASNSGPVLVFRKNAEYCETVFANGAILDAAHQEIQDSLENINDNTPDADDNISYVVTDRAIFRIFSDNNLNEKDPGYIHFGYYESSGGTDSPVVPLKYYDFTNPFAIATYRGFTTDLTFSSIGYDANGRPSWVLCKINILSGSEIVYSRETILCFSAPVQ